MTAGIPLILRKTGAHRAPLQHAPPQFLLALLLILSSLLSAAIARQAPPQVWLGIGITAEKDILAIEGTTAKSGLRITRLSFNSPADKAGLIIDDLIVGAEGRDFTAESSTLERQFPEFILQHAPGDSITLRVVRDRELIDIRIIVEERPEQAPVKEYSSPKIEWPEEHLAGALIDVFRKSRIKREEAFAKLTPDEEQFFEQNCEAVFNAFAERIDLATDRNRERWHRDSHLLELATKVDFAKLFEGAELLWRVAEDNYLDDLELALRKAWQAGGKPEGIFINRETSAGKILVGGNGSTRYSEDASIVLDLGGNDFYANNSGSARGGTLPSALLIDFAGNDAYEATDNWTAGAARMGYSVLVDRKGNDEYIGRAWTQGAAILGAALFLDESGNDIYRAAQYAQGAAAWGIALHIDYDGDDTYDARLLSQAVG